MSKSVSFSQNTLFVNHPEPLLPSLELSLPLFLFGPTRRPDRPFSGKPSFSVIQNILEMKTNLHQKIYVV